MKGSGNGFALRMVASQAGHPSTVQVFLTLGADPNVKWGHDTFHTPPSLMARRGSFEIVTQLLAAAADPAMDPDPWQARVECYNRLAQEARSLAKYEVT